MNEPAFVLAEVLSDEVSDITYPALRQGWLLNERVMVGQSGMLYTVKVVNRLLPPPEEGMSQLARKMDSFVDTKHRHRETLEELAGILKTTNSENLVIEPDGKWYFQYKDTSGFWAVGMEGGNLVQLAKYLKDYKT